MINPADTSLPLATGMAPNPKIVFEDGSALPPIKLARATQGSSDHWLFRVDAYEHQESYGSEREAMESESGTRHLRVLNEVEEVSFRYAITTD